MSHLHLNHQDTPIRIPLSYLMLRFPNWIIICIFKIKLLFACSDLGNYLNDPLESCV